MPSVNTDIVDNHPRIEIRLDAVETQFQDFDDIRPRLRQLILRLNRSITPRDTGRLQKSIQIYMTHNRIRVQWGRRDDARVQGRTAQASIEYARYVQRRYNFAGRIAFAILRWIQNTLILAGPIQERGLGLGRPLGFSQRSVVRQRELLGRRPREGAFI